MMQILVILRYLSVAAVLVAFSTANVLASNDKAIDFYGRIPTDEEVDKYWFEINEDTNKQIKYYHSNGILRHSYSKGGLCGAIFGVENYYNQTGKVEKKIEHINFEKKGCSAGYSIVTVSKFNLDGKLETKYSYFRGYESEEACKCGVWTNYSNGRIIRSTKFQSCSSSRTSKSICYSIQ